MKVPTFSGFYPIKAHLEPNEYVVRFYLIVSYLPVGAGMLLAATKVPLATSVTVWPNESLCGRFALFGE
jgi:hypothetical protein